VRQDQYAATAEVGALAQEFNTSGAAVKSAGRLTGNSEVQHV